MNSLLITALGPGDPDDGDEGRQQRGMAIAALVRVDKNRLGYKVPSQSGNGSYIVNTDDTPFCTCPDFERRQQPCKHVYAVEYIIQREERGDDRRIETLTARLTTYPQHWPAYNMAQQHEQEHFATLLRDLCDTIPVYRRGGPGRPRLPLDDMIFSSGLKVYSTMSGRRAMTEIRGAQRAGKLAKAPSATSTWRYMEDPNLTPLLKTLIEQSALPLRAIETDFAVDSSGFNTSVYGERWFDKKWGKTIRKNQWVKAHIMCGVQTNIVTAVEVTLNNSSDAVQLPNFVNTTAQHFTVSEVSADKAYLSKKNLWAVQAVGGWAYIPFKVNSTGHHGHHKRDTLWERAFHFYNLNRAEFLDRYHKRSNVETTFSMVKAKFGPAVRSKSPAAQVNEVLLKFLCHNICVLIQSAYELGVAPIFDLETQEDFGAHQLSAPKLAWQ